MPLWLRSGGGASPAEGPVRAFRVAGRTVLADVVLEELAAFEVPLPDGAPEWPSWPAEGWRGDGWRGDGEILFDDVGRVGRAMVGVVCRRRGADYELEVDRQGRFLVRGDGSAIVALEHLASPAVTAEVLLGPCLCLALALGDTFCFHAGVVDAGGAACAFLGASGLGKSTLARYLGDRPRGDWRRATDDIAPVAITDDIARLRPHFPQLKLAPEEQWEIERPESLPLERLYFLDTTDSLDTADFLNPSDPSPAGEPAEVEAGVEASMEARVESGVEIQPLGRRDCTLELVRHSVAAKLFAPDLLARHLDFCSRLSDLVAARRLRFTRAGELLPRVVEAVRRDLADDRRAEPRRL